MMPSVYPLIGLAVCMAALLAIALSPYLKAFRHAWFVVAVVVAMLYAGTKPNTVFQFALGLQNDGSTYAASNGVAVAQWTWDNAVADCTFRWAYQINGGQWVQLPDYAVTDGVAVAVIPAEEGDTVKISCYPQIVTPPQIITNGVYHLNGVSRSMDTAESSDPKFVPFLIPIVGERDDGSSEHLTPTNSPPAGLRSGSPENEGE